MKTKTPVKIDTFMRDVQLAAMAILKSRWGIVFCLLLAFAAPAFAQQPAVFQTLQRLRAEYPAHMEPAQLAELLNRTAYEHRDEGWKLLKKGSGNSCPLKPGNVFISCDILIGGPGNPPHHFDVLVASDEVALPSWQDVGPCELGPTSGCSLANAIDPIRPTNTPAPIPTPPQPSPVVDLAPILARLDALNAVTMRLRSDLQFLAAAFAAESQELRRIIADIQSKPVPCSALPPYTGKNWAGRITSTAVCK
jgi:hypothetical protein